MTGICNSRFDPQGFSKTVAVLPTHIILLLLFAAITELWENMHCIFLMKCLLIHFFFIMETVFKVLGHKNHLSCTDSYLNIHFCLQSEIPLLLFNSHRRARVTGNAVTNENYNNINTPLIHSVWPPHVELHQTYKRLVILRQAPNFWFSLWLKRKEESKKINSRFEIMFC